MVKPYAVIFVPWLARGNAEARSSTMLAGLVVLLLLPVARYGWDGNLQLLGGLVADGDHDHRPQSHEPGQRVAERDVRASGSGAESPAAMLAAAAGAILLLLTGIVMAGRGTLPRTDTLEARCCCC